MDPTFVLYVSGGCIHTPHACVNAAEEKETDYDRTNSYMEFSLIRRWTGNGNDYSRHAGVYVMNEFDKFMARLDVMEFHLNESMIFINDDESLIITKWKDELNQILKMYMDICQINSGRVIEKTQIQNDPYYGKEGPK